MRLSPLRLPRAAHSLAQPLRFDGIGLHSGAPAQLVLEPHPQGWALALGPSGKAWPIEQLVLFDSNRATTLCSPEAERFATVEHVLAAISGAQLDAVCVRLLSGPEFPAFDGSAAALAESIAAATKEALPRQAWVWALGGELELKVGSAWARLEAADQRSISCSIDFPELGRQEASWAETDDFCGGLARARTFAFVADLDKLQQQGLAKGGSLHNALLLDAGARTINPEGQRFENEAAMHKLLDLLGDLARLGAPLRARLVAHRPGHRFNAALVEALESIKERSA
ncbi:MAG: UDP-3-O-acyl-N-acetylglucosamine deacetylase [Myxococcota bacterium]|nr:UDP-3-O-acyl-N-acetylglucosamine deacetylase [Myxococcota bacterium]